MKKLILLLIIIPFISSAQNEDFSVRHISVSGEADTTIVPNEIYTVLTIKEYKEGGKIVPLNSLERQLVKAVKSTGITESNLKVDNIYGYNWDWKKKKSDDFLTSKSFELKTSDLNKLNDLLAKLDPQGLNRVYIKKYSHTDLEQIEQNLKVQAVKNAESKATVLLKSLNEGLGEVLKINENQNRRPYPMERMEVRALDTGEYQSNLSFKEITLEASVNIVFAIED